MRKALIALVTVLAMSGCFSSSQDYADGGCDVDASLCEDEEGDSVWRQWANETITLRAGAGIPFYENIGIASDFGSRFFHVPDNTTRLSAYLNSSFVNASSAGVGYGTFFVKHAEENPHYPAQQASTPVTGPLDVGPREASWVEVENPKPGDWAIWVWPKGVVINQDFHVTIHVRGTGTEPCQIELTKDHQHDDAGDRCDE